MSGTEFYGEILKQRRQQRQLSLDDVALQTRIRRVYLVALEEGRFDDFPAETYVKGFLRNYSDFLGLDPNEILEKYREQRPDVADPDNELRSIETGLVQSVRHSPAQRRYLLLFVFLALLIAAGLTAGYLLTQKPGILGVMPDSPVPVEVPDSLTPSDGESSQGVSELSNTPEKDSLPVALSKAEPESFPEKKASSSSDEVFSPPAVSPGAAVKLRAVEPTQLEVVIDHRPRQQYELRVGSVLTWRVEERAELIIERPEAVRVELNDRLLDLEGHSRVLIATSRED